MCIRKADSVGVRFLFVYAYSVFSSMIGFIYPFAARFFFTCSVSLRKNFGERKKYVSFTSTAHTAQFTRLFRSKRIGLLYPCYTPALTLFIVAASNAALVLFLVPHTMRLFFVFRCTAIPVLFAPVPLLRIKSANCQHLSAISF